MTSPTGRHALVTGASRGIGRAIAQSLSADGAHVTLLVRNRLAGESVQSELPGSSHVVEADVTDEAAVHRACADATSDFGPVHILVNNAGSVETASFAKSDDALFRKMLAVHLFGPLYCTQALLPEMVDAKFGRVINIASTAGVSGAAYISAYCAAKHALVGLTRSLAKEVVTRGVTVNAICPGYTQTDMLSTSIQRISARTGITGEAAASALLQHNPLHRFISPDEVAAAVVWLSSDGAASVTGQTIIIDGGELA
ncbi:MAG: SDR family oxidoreductase [Gemmatimonadaceae bacterium]